MTTAHLTPVGPTRFRRPSDLPAVARRLTHALESSAARVRGGGDAEAIHDLRVTCRRLSSALSAWRDALDPKRRERVQRGLRQLRRRLADARELEVLAEHFAELFTEGSLTVREAGVAEHERLVRRVALARARAAFVTRRRRIARLLTRVEACLESFVPDRPLLPALQESASTLRQEALDALAAAGHQDDALHRARIQVKRWRYHLEAMTGVAGGAEASAERLSALRTLQQCLGAIHDAAVLRDFTARRALRARAKGRDARHAALVWLSEQAERARWRALEHLPSAAMNAGATPRP